MTMLDVPVVDLAPYREKAFRLVECSRVVRV